MHLPGMIAWDPSHPAGSETRDGFSSSGGSTEDSRVNGGSNCDSLNSQSWAG